MPATGARIGPRIAVIRALQLGDLLSAVPAFRALRTGEPEAHVTLIGLPWARVLLDRFPGYVDAHVSFPGYPGIPEWPHEDATLGRFLEAARASAFDLVLQLHGDGTHINSFAQALGAARVAGFVPTPREEDSEHLAYPASLPEPERHLALLRHLGYEATDASLEFPVWPADREAACEVLEAVGVAGKRYAIVHAGSSTLDRRWSPASFATIADELTERGLEVLLTGTSEERGLVAVIAALMRGRGRALAGLTSLGTLAALVEGARVIVCNDTGVSHLAATLATPSVVIFTGSDRRRWAPRDGARHRAVGAGRADGSQSPPATVEVYQVLDALDAVLGSTR
jgi:ADP-heptose:LPS heptosyltransferase